MAGPNEHFSNAAAGEKGENRTQRHKSDSLLESIQTLHLAKLFQLFALHSLLLSVFNGRGLLKVLPPLEFPNNSFFLNHALEAPDGFFQGLIIVYSYVSDGKSPPFVYEFSPCQFGIRANQPLSYRSDHRCQEGADREKPREPPARRTP